MHSAKVERIIDSHLSFSGSTANYDVYESRYTAHPKTPGFEKTPHCVYFYYVRIDRSGKVRVDHYLYAEGPLKDPTKWPPIPYKDMPDIVYKLALNGRPGVRCKDPPKLDTHNFDDIPWKRKSYIAIFIDEGNWSFHRRQAGKPSVAFDPDWGTPNHSFFDALDLVFDMPNKYTKGTDKRSAIFFINHMKRNAKGDDLLKWESQPFKFDMWLAAVFAETSQRGMTANFDPGGTNLGPPLPPP